MRARIGQQRDELVEALEPVRPSVNENQRKRRRSETSLVNEVKFRATNFGDGMCIPVERRFLHPLVKLMEPVIDQLGQVSQVHSIVPAPILKEGRTTERSQSLAKIIEHIRINADFKWLYHSCHRLVGSTL